MPNTPDVGFQFGVEGDASLLGVIRQLREEMAKLRKQQDDLGDSANGLNRAWGGITGGSTEARHAIMLLGEETGVHVPRAVATLISKIGPMQGLLANAFPIIGAIALIAVVAKAIEHFKEMKRRAEEQREEFIKLDGTYQDTSLHIQAEIDKEKQKFIELTEGPIRALEFALGHLPSIAIPALKEIEAEMDKFAALAKKNAGLFGQGNIFGQVEEDVNKFKADAEEAMRAMPSGAKIQAELAKINPTGKAPDDAMKRQAEDLARLQAGLEKYEEKIQEVSSRLDRMRGPQIIGDKKLPNIPAANIVPVEKQLEMLKTARGQLTQAQNDVNQTFTTERKGLDIAKAKDAAERQRSAAELAADAQSKANAKELKEFRDDVARRSEIDKEAYGSGEISLEEYYRRRKEQIISSGAEEQSILERQANIQANRLLVLRKLFVGPTTGEQLAHNKEIQTAEDRIHELVTGHRDAELKQERDLAALETQRRKDEIQHQLKTLEARRTLAEAQGDKKGADALQAQIDNLKTRIELLQAGIKAADIDDALAKLAAARDIRTTAEGAQHGFEGGVAGLEEKKAQLQEQVASGALQPYQAEQQLKAAYQAEIPILQQKVDLLRQQATLAQSGELRDSLTKEADKDEAEIAKLTAESHKLGAEWKGEVKNSISGAVNTATHGFNSALLGMQSFAQAARQAWIGIMTTALNSIENIAAKWIEQHLLMKEVQKLLHTDDNGPQEQAAQTVAANVTKASSDAAVSGGETFMYALEQSAGDIPYALAQASIAYGIGAGFAGAAGLAAGGLVAKSYVGGGSISGPGSSTSDSVPIWGSNGEFMFKASSTRAIGAKTLALLNDNPQLWQQAVRGAQLPPIRQQAPYSAAGLRRYGPNGEVSPAAAAGPSFSHSTHIGNLSALDGASVRAALEEHGDLVGKIAVAAVKKHFRNGGVNG